MNLSELRKELREYGSKEKKEILQRFFKTGKGEYGEGDVFLGVVVPDQRKLAKKYESLNFEEIKDLINSKIHEERLTGLLILVEKYKKNVDERKKIYEFYIENINGINNWDLVDLSAPNIVGEWILDKDKRVLKDLVKSDNIWKRRIAIVSTYSLIRKGKFEETLDISKILLKDKHDLIHKAVGWMLREVGKREEKKLIEFLDENYKIMPRTMLRYSIERFPEDKRKKYMKK